MPRKVVLSDDEDEYDEGVVYMADEPAPQNSATPEDEGSDDEDAVSRPRRRSRLVPGSLVEEDPLAELDEFKDVIDDDDKEAFVPKRSSRSRSKPPDDDDDEFFDDEIVSDDDDFLDKLQEKNFIASDDDGAPDMGYSSRSRARKRRRHRPNRSPRKRLTRATAMEDDSYDEDGGKEGGDEDDDILKEVEDLYDSSPAQSPIRHKLRERPEVNYTIPPPLPANGDVSSLGYGSNVSRSGGSQRRGRTKADSRRLLFPTAGPFGGADVVSLYGGNLQPMTNTNQLLGDSDSSDDEIMAMDASKSLPGPPVAKPIAAGGLGAIGGATGKVKNNLSDTDPLGVDMNIDFSAVGGLDNYINQLKEMVALPLLYPELYQNFSITPPRGVLFHGPPGTGKTLMARALAASCSTQERKITFYMRKGADCLSKWVGEAERQLRLLFEEAKKNQPAIIFFDEIDGLAPVRSSKQEQIHASIVSTLLALMDGMDNRGQVIVIGATNRPDAVDPALRRPGRFDREFYFPLPDVAARREILSIHTRKWTPALASEFVAKLADLTKGYGGADLRALCTEAALNSIQRKYPQIYTTNDKLKVNPKSIQVIASDFIRALDKIVPSSARSTTSASAPLPEQIAPLLQGAVDGIRSRLLELLPTAPGLADPGKKRRTALDDALYYDPSVADADGGFGRHQLLQSLERSRVCKPHLLVRGPAGNGQQYLGSAILNFLEGFQVQQLDVSALLGESNRTVETAIIQSFIEARRHQPSIIFIPNVDIWSQVVPPTATATLVALLRTLKADEPVLVLGISEGGDAGELEGVFGYGSEGNTFDLVVPHASERTQYFKSVIGALRMKPFEFINDVANRPKRKLKKLPVVAPTSADKSSDRRRRKQQHYFDTKLKNVLKIRLAGIMDLFKNRYKRFKKPIIDDSLLVHLFEPIPVNPMLPPYEILYEKSVDPEHENMIKELTTGHYFYNMDLDIIEERLWNGFYSEPRQFLKDIRMIVKDAKTSGDRERILKAEEMLTNAQFAIDEFANPEFIKECKEMREREIKLQEEFAKSLPPPPALPATEEKIVEVGNSDVPETGAEGVSGVDGTVESNGNASYGVPVTLPGSVPPIEGIKSEGTDQPGEGQVLANEAHAPAPIAAPVPQVVPANFHGGLSQGSPVGYPGPGYGGDVNGGYPSGSPPAFVPTGPPTGAPVYPHQSVYPPGLTAGMHQNPGYHMELTQHAPSSMQPTIPGHPHTPISSVHQPLAPGIHDHSQPFIPGLAPRPASGQWGASGPAPLAAPAVQEPAHEAPGAPVNSVQEPAQKLPGATANSVQGTAPVVPAGPAPIKTVSAPARKEIATMHSLVPASVGEEATPVDTPGLEQSSDDQPKEPTPEESEPEPESEYEELDFPDKQLVIDNNRAESLFTNLISKTESFPVEHLQSVMARLMEVVWNDRGEWDKTVTLEKLEKIVNGLA